MPGLLVSLLGRTRGKKQGQVVGLCNEFVGVFAQFSENITCLDAPKWNPIGHSVDLLGIKNFLSCNFMLSIQIYIIYVGGRHLFFLTKETLETEQKLFISSLSIDRRLNYPC